MGTGQERNSGRQGMQLLIETHTSMKRRRLLNRRSIEFSSRAEERLARDMSNHAPLRHRMQDPMAVPCRSKNIYAASMDALKLLLISKATNASALRND